MHRRFTVGMNLGKKPQRMTVDAEDALVAALRVKHEMPEATITYVRRSNARGDRRHPPRFDAPPEPD